jgi:hypothetical protein
LVIGNALGLGFQTACAERKPLPIGLWSNVRRYSGQPKLEVETAALPVSDLSVGTVAHEARNIAALWPSLETDGKRRLVSTLCTGIIIVGYEPEAPIEITFAHSASPNVEAPIRIGAASEPVNADSSENFPEISNRLNSQRRLGLEDATPLALAQVILLHEAQSGMRD